jgi:glucosamine--fructose-6-phosphate aminotransferase (isomerizing)
VHDDHIVMQTIMTLADRATWRTSVDLADAAVPGWIRGLGGRRPARVYLVGCGTSHYAAQVGKRFFESLAHVPADAQQGYAFATYAEPAILGPDTPVIGISTSGGSDAVVAALARARAAGAPTVAVTSNGAAAVAQGADTVILTGGEGDKPNCKTASYVQSLITPYLMALALGEQQGLIDAGKRAYWRGQIDEAARATAEFLERRAEGEALARAFSEATNVIVLGTGANAGTAQEAALKVIEMAKLYSEPQELEDFLHGRVREVDERTPIIFVAPKGRASGRVLDFLTVTDRIGVPTAVLTNEVTPGIQRLASHVIHLPSDLDELATPFLYIVPLYVFSVHLALLRGWEPTSRRYEGFVPQRTRYEGER